MPWTPKDASHSTRKADTPAKRRQWAHVANSALDRTGDDGLAKRLANAVIKNHPSRKRK